MSGPPRRGPVGPLGLPADQVSVVQRRTDDWVVLDRCDEMGQDDTEYCVHGRVTCARCWAMCWLGDRTLQLVQSGQCNPLCRRCATAVLPAGPGGRAAGNAGDHRRSDGPH